MGEEGLMFGGAVGTEAAEHEVDGGGFEAFGEGDGGEWGVFEAVSLLALLTEEMGMLIIVLFVIVAMTQFVLHALAATFDDMDEVMRTEERQSTEDA